MCCTAEYTLWFSSNLNNNKHAYCCYKEEHFNMGLMSIAFRARLRQPLEEWHCFWHVWVGFIFQAPKLPLVVSTSSISFAVLNCWLQKTTVLHSSTPFFIKVHFVIGYILPLIWAWGCWNVHYHHTSCSESHMFTLQFFSFRVQKLTNDGTTNRNAHYCGLFMLWYIC